MSNANTLLRRMLNARRYGVVFLRDRWFRMPRKIKLGNAWLPLAYPDEHGVSIDFLTCLVRDEYGLGECPTEPATILDIGANIGLFALAARGRYPEANIHCYEPNPRALPYLRSNAYGAKFTVYAEAVGANNGRVQIVDMGDSNQAATVDVEGAGISKVGFEVAVGRLGYVDLLKLDCEGAEWDIFRSQEAWRMVRELRMEYHLVHNHTVNDVKESLAALDFSTTRFLEGPGFGMVWATNRKAV
jgi:FkbM family methyltransferase